VCKYSDLRLVIAFIFVLIRATVHSMTLDEQIDFLEPLCSKLIKAETVQEKLKILDSSPFTQQFLATSPVMRNQLTHCTAEEEIVLKAILAIGQAPYVFYGLEKLEDAEMLFKKFLDKLGEVENFFNTIGGIAGYQLQFVKRLNAKSASDPLKSISLLKPVGTDILHDDPNLIRIRERWGIEHMAEMAEIYPIGGAGDRLNLKDKEGNSLPAAMLPFCGRTLLEGLIRDLQGREYLYYKLFNKQLILPLAIMTSHEKNNDMQIRELFKEHDWFGRPEERFAFFIQPLVPMITVEGNWAMQGPLKPFFKPGGHGVIWKTAQDQGIFDWLERFNCRKALLRQINNPVAGTDNGLLVLSGIGCHENKQFGFASCFRLINTAEGMNVLKEKKVSSGYEYSVSNIEYTDFKHHCIEDIPEQEGCCFSCFPANTNILFADLQKVKEAVKLSPFPGVIINMKNQQLCDGPQGKEEKQCGRLESMMQNIADSLTETFPNKLEEAEQKNLATFLIYNERRKTISVTKKAYENGKPLVETPEGCFYELMQNYRELLTKNCQMQLPPQQDEKEYMTQGPSFITLFHPALGGLFSVIGHKINGGVLANGAEWIMEVAEAEVRNLDLQGSLIIKADAIMGEADLDGVLQYSSKDSGKCSLINVQIRNKGIEKVSFRDVWKQEYPRAESLSITLHGNAEFFAENVIFEGDLHIDVPRGYRMKAMQDGSTVKWTKEKIETANWYWNYKFDGKKGIVLDSVLKP
jgi:UTP---glucose-1-phosphate uridylyltransferase